MASKKQSAVVIGGGIVGQCCAFQLQKAGYAVTVVERNEIGDTTAAGTSGVLATTHVAPVALPGMLPNAGNAVDAPGPLIIRSRYINRLLPFLAPFYAASEPQVAEGISEGLRRINSVAFDAFGEIVSELAAPELVDRKGWLYVYESEAAYQRAQPELDYRRRRGCKVEPLTQAQVREMEPALTETISRGIYLPEAGHMADPAGFVKRVAAHVTKRGGKIVRDEIKSFEVDAAGNVTARSAQAAYSGDVVVLAAGVWVADLIKSVGLFLPCGVEAGYSITYGDPGFALRRPISSGDHKCVANSMTNGLRVTLGADFTDADAEMDNSQIEKLTQAAKKLFKKLPGSSPTPWRGFRCTTPDTLPAIGRVRNNPNLLLAVGLGHLGVTLAAVTGKIIATTAMGDSHSWPDLRVDRFQSFLGTPARPAGISPSVQA